MSSSKEKSKQPNDDSPTNSSKSTRKSQTKRQNQNVKCEDESSGHSSIICNEPPTKKARQIQNKSTTDIKKTKEREELSIHCDGLFLKFTISLNSLLSN